MSGIDADPSYLDAAGEGPFFAEVRLHLDGGSLMARLSTAAGYIYARLCDTSSCLLNEVLPYRYVWGRHHGKVEGKFRRWDARLDAHGQEGIVEELQRRIWSYERRRLGVLRKRWDALSRPFVYIIEDQVESPAGVDIVFSNIEALDRVRPRSFMDDCCSMQGPNYALGSAVGAELFLLERFIRAEHQEVLLTYDPKVTHIRDRYLTLHQAARRSSLAAE